MPPLEWFLGVALHDMLAADSTLCRAHRYIYAVHSKEGPPMQGRTAPRASADKGPRGRAGRRITATTLPCLHALDSRVGGRGPLTLRCGFQLLIAPSGPLHLCFGDARRCPLSSSARRRRRQPGRCQLFPPRPVDVPASVRWYVFLVLVLRRRQRWDRWWACPE